MNLLESPHDETCAKGGLGDLLGQDQLAEFGGLQSVEGAVVHDAHGLASFEELRAFEHRYRTRCLDGRMAATRLVERRMVQDREGIRCGWHLEFPYRSDD